MNLKSLKPLSCPQEFNRVGLEKKGVRNKRSEA
jgi:hypothetical protein